MCIYKYVSVALRNKQCLMQLMLKYNAVTFLSLGIWNVLHQVHVLVRGSDARGWHTKIVQFNVDLSIHMIGVYTPSILTTSVCFHLISEPFIAMQMYLDAP